MSDSKLSVEMVEQDTSRDSESDSDSDVSSDFGICPCQAELEKLPEVLMYIKRLQSFLYRQQSELGKIRKQLKEHVSLVRMWMYESVFLIQSALSWCDIRWLYVICGFSVLCLFIRIMFAY
jgi:Trm5-related predicted tRNA methylase